MATNIQRAAKRRLSAKNPFNEVNKALSPPTTAATAPGRVTRTTEDLSAPKATSREAGIAAALRAQAARKSRFQRSSTNKGKR